MLNDYGDNKKLSGLFSKAVTEGRVDCVNVLINKINNRWAGNVIDLSNLVGEKNKTALHYAVEVQDFGMVKELIKQGINVNAIDSNGNTAFHLAAKGDDPRIVNAIMFASNEDMKKKNNKGQTPLDIAISGGNPEVFSNIFNYYSFKVDAGNVTSQDTAKEKELTREVLRLMDTKDGLHIEFDKKSGASLPYTQGNEPKSKVSFAQKIAKAVMTIISSMGFSNSRER